MDRSEIQRLLDNYNLCIIKTNKVKEVKDYLDSNGYKYAHSSKIVYAFLNNQVVMDDMEEDLSDFSENVSFYVTRSSIESVTADIFRELNI